MHYNLLFVCVRYYHQVLLAVVSTSGYLRYFITEQPSLSFFSDTLRLA